MSKIEEKCKEKGVRLTEQRKVIAKVISESKPTYGAKDHPDVDELHKRVNKVDTKISIATVYRTVKLFEESGIIARHDFKGNKLTNKESHSILRDYNNLYIVADIKSDQDAQAKLAKDAELKRAIEYQEQRKKAKKVLNDKKIQKK